MANYNCLMIDLDDTLLDFAACEEAALEKTFAQFDFPFTPESTAAYREINNELWRQLEQGKVKKEVLMTGRWKQFLAHLGKLGNAAKINDFYLSCLAEQSFVLPGALEFLQEVEDYVTVAIITNGAEKAQKGRLVNSGVGTYADGIFISEKMGIHKPDKRFVNIALDRLGVTNRSRVLVVGDSLQADVKCGRDAGLDTCWCNFKDEVNDTDIIPTYTVRGFEELKRVILTEEELSYVNDAHKTEV